ncbi:MAG: DUF2029 domain-containing protein [Bdellovibrionales bacterium]|nr:DUF2029 domain-containing protein [Bdellovibrionales bacterium]
MRIPVVLRTVALLVGLALWIGWGWSITTGKGAMDRTGTVVGTDFVMFYAAGQTVLRGETERLYDQEFQKELQQKLIGERFSGYYHLYTPPLFAVPFTMFAGTDYQTSFFIWTLLSFFCLVNALRFLQPRSLSQPLLFSLPLFPVFAGFSFGQNSNLSLLIMAATCALWIGGRDGAAGMVLSLLFYKPQLLLGVVLLWCLDWRESKRALAGLACGLAVLALLQLLFMPQATAAYLSLATERFADLNQSQGFPVAKQLTLAGLVSVLVPGIPGVLHHAVLLAGMFWAALLLRRFISRWGDERQWLFAAAIGATFWLSPHAMVYDGTLLLIPAVIAATSGYVRQRDFLRIAAVGWVALLFGARLTQIQLDLLGFAINIGALATLCLGWWFLRLQRPLPRLRGDGREQLEEGRE